MTRRLLPALLLVACSADPAPAPAPVPDASATVDAEPDAPVDPGCYEDADLPTRGRAPARVDTTVVTVTADGLRLLPASDAKAAAAAFAAAPVATATAALQPVVLPAGEGGAEVWLVEPTGQVQALTRTGELLGATTLEGTCLQPGGTDDTLVVPVADGEASRVEVLGAPAGEPKSLLAIPLGFEPTTPVARLATGGSHWLVGGAGHLALVDLNLGAVTATTTDVDGVPGGLLTAGDRVLVPSRTTSIPCAALGDRLLRYRHEAGALVRLDDIVPPGPILADPVAVPPCAEATGGSHWWCDEGLVATGGSHWHGGWDLTTGALRWEHADDGAVFTGLALGDDGRVYTGGSHWLSSGTWRVTSHAGTLPPDPVLELPADAPTWVDSPLFTCAGRLAVQTPDAVVLTDVEASAHAAGGAWARGRGGATQRGHAADLDACPDPTVPPPDCGDGDLDPGELCDDGNTITEVPSSTDPVCSADCQLSWQQASPTQFTLTTLQQAQVYRARFLVDDLEIAGLYCLPKGAGPHPLVVVGTGGLAGVTNATGDTVCAAAAAQGVAVAMPQLRGQAASPTFASEGTVEVCGGEVRDAAEALRHALTMPGVDPTRVAVLGVAEGACAVLQLVAGAPDLLGDAAPPFAGALVLGAPVDLPLLHADATASDHPLAATMLDALETSAGGTPDEAPAAYAARSVLPDVPALLALDPPLSLAVLQTIDEPVVTSAQGCQLRGALVDAGASVRDVYPAELTWQAITDSWPFSDVPGCEDGAPVAPWPSTPAAWLAADIWFAAIPGAAGNLDALEMLELAGAMTDFIVSRLVSAGR